MTISPVSNQIAPKMSASVPDPPRGTPSRRCRSSNSMWSLSPCLWLAQIAQAGPRRRAQWPRPQGRELEASFRSILICIFERKNAITLTLFLLCLLRLSYKPGYVPRGESLCCPQKIGHFPRALADDLGQIGRDLACQCEQFVGIATDDFSNLSHLVLGRWIKITPLDLGQIGRANTDLLRHLAQPDLFGLPLLTYQCAETFPPRHHPSTP